MQYTIFALAALALVCVASVEPARATNGTKPIASGVRSGGRGGVDIGIADDATAINSNPAGLAFIDGQRFDSSTVLVFPKATFSGPVDSSSSRHDFLVAGSFGFVFDFAEPWQLGEALTLGEGEPSKLPSRLDPEYGTTKYGDSSGLKLGFGIFPVAGNLLDFDMTTPFWDADPVAGLDRESQAYEADLKELAVSAALAWRVNEFFSIGISPSFIYSKLEIDQSTAQPVSLLAGHPFSNDPNDDVTYADLASTIGERQVEGFSDIDDASTLGFRVRLGAMLNPADWLSIGITYASPTFKQDYLGETTIDFNRMVEKLDSSGPIGASTFKGLVAANTGIPPDQQNYAGRGNIRLDPFNQPHELGIGLGFFFYPFMFGVDVTWLNWSSVAKEVNARITDNTSAELNELTGDLSTTQTLVVPLDWDDQIVLAIGGAVAVTDWLSFRAGYNYGRNPVPTETLLPTTPAILEHHITGGMSLHVNRVELSLSVEWNLPSKVKIQNSRANENFNDHEIEISAIFVGLGFGLKF